MHSASKIKQISRTMLSRKSRESGVVPHFEHMLSQFSIPRIVLVANGVTSSHALRSAMRSAGLTASLDLVTNREEFLASFEHGSVDLVIAAAPALEGLSIAEIQEQTDSKAASIPIILLVDHSVEGDDLQKSSNADSAHVHVMRTSQLDRLPSIFERLLRKYRTQNAN